MRRHTFRVAEDTSGMERPIGEFIDSCNHRRDHQGIGNVAPAGVQHGRPEAILKRREEKERATLEEPLRYNRSR